MMREIRGDLPENVIRQILWLLDQPLNSTLSFGEESDLYQVARFLYGDSSSRFSSLEDVLDYLSVRGESVARPVDWLTLEEAEEILRLLDAPNNSMFHFFYAGEVGMLGEIAAFLLGKPQQYSDFRNVEGVIAWLRA